MFVGTITGRSGKKIEVNDTPRGKVCNFSLATEQRRKGEKETIWFNCEVWGDRGENFQKYMKPGGRVTLIGDVVVEHWVNREGVKETGLQLIVHSYEIHDYAPSNSGADGGGTTAPVEEEPEEEIKF